jgi:hypothetical protein
MIEGTKFTKKIRKEIPIYLFGYWIIGNYLEFGLPAGRQGFGYWDLVSTPVRLAPVYLGQTKTTSL